MKIFAGGKFQTRKPATAMANNNGAQINCAASLTQYNRQAPRQTQIASTLAIPSIPSMKL
ncbi:hypothetical protein D3C76_1823210 [compost metagenome]